MDQESPAAPTAEATPNLPNTEPSTQKVPFRQGKFFIPVLVILLVVLIGGGVYAFGFRNRSEGADNEQNSPQPTPTNQASNSLFLQQNGQNCVNREVAFTSPTIPLEDLGYITPMGKMLDGHVTPTDHVYVHPLNSRAADNTYSAVMPADGAVISIGAMPAQYVGDNNQEVASEDHRITVMHSCRYFSIYIHVHKLDEKLQAAVGTLAPNQNKNVYIELKAGDRLGGIGAQGHDWTLVDTETTLTGFITPNLYEGESWKIHSIDPLSVYTGELKTKLESLSLRSVAPFGGKIDFDQPGKLIGNWFREGTDGYSGKNGGAGGRYWDGHLSIVPDHIDPSFVIVSIGNWQNDTAAQFVAQGTPLDPATISPTSGPIKYELAKLSYMSSNNQGWTGNETFSKGIKPSITGPTLGTLLAEVLDGEKLKVEKFPGKTAAQVSGFTEAAQTYYR